MRASYSCHSEKSRDSDAGGSQNGSPTQEDVLISSFWSRPPPLRLL
jgi:hypothetical protein